MEIFAEECFEPRCWARFLDQYPGQFRSRFVNDNLLHAPERIARLLQEIVFLYFESHEGKNSSDSLGALAKQADARAVARGCNILDGLRVEGGGDADAMSRILEQVKARILSGMTFENGRVGNYAFFR